jgi:hypothetical protein
MFVELCDGVALVSRKLVGDDNWENNLKSCIIKVADIHRIERKIYNNHDRNNRQYELSEILIWMDKMLLSIEHKQDHYRADLYHKWLKEELDVKE